jgi:hypothetical protein
MQRRSGKVEIWVGQMIKLKSGWVKVLEMIKKLYISDA